VERFAVAVKHVRNDGPAADPLERRFFETKVNGDAGPEERPARAGTPGERPDLSVGYLGDVGDVLTSPQTMGVTVPAGGTIDVVVYAIDVGPAGVGSYALSCSTQ